MDPSWGSGDPRSPAQRFPENRYPTPDPGGIKMRLTRRRLVISAGAGAAAALLPSPAGLTAAQEAPPLPPPLKPDVFRDRQTRLRAERMARRLDALCVAPSTTLAHPDTL